MTGSWWRRSRLTIACAARPISTSGRSQITHAAPTATISTKTIAPASAALVRCGSTATPVMIAGSASSGSASSVPNTSSDDAVMPDAAVTAGTPERTSMEYWRAPEAATPPGTTRPNEFAASWDRITGRPAIGAQRQPLDSPQARVAADL